MVQADVLVLARDDGLLFDVLRPAAGLRPHGMSRGPLQPPPAPFCQLVGLFHQISSDPGTRSG